MKFLIFALLIVSSYAIDFDCLKGPSFWCANEENAVKCGRKIECSMTNPKIAVVQMSKIKEPKYCELCKEIVGTLEKQIIPQFTEAQFINFVVNNVCPKLEKDLNKLCVTLVRQYGHEIYTELTNIISPNNVCAYMELCSANIKRIGSPETCKICKEVFSVLESLLTSISPDELKALLKMTLCNTLPASVKVMCDTLVDGYTDQIYNLLKSILDGDRVCPALHLCASSTNKKVSDWQLKTCIDVVTVLKTDLANVSVADVSSVVDDKACVKVPSLFRSMCENLINENIGPFMTKLHSAMTPAQICAQTIQTSPNFKHKKTDLKSVGNVIECDACELLVKEFRKRITSSSEVLKLKNFIKTQICKYFGSQQQMCVEFVDKYMDILINFINTHLTDRQICQLIGACSESETLFYKSSTKIVSGIECDTCKIILSAIKKYVADPRHVAEFKNFLKNTVCPFFGSENTACQQVVDEYFTIIFNAIMTQFDVDTICKFGKFCVKPAYINYMVRQKGVECEVCEVVMGEIINIATTNDSQVKVMNFLKNTICPELGSLKDECISLVNTYLPYIFNVARESLNSKILCSRLNLCSTVSLKKMNALLRNLKVKSFQCDMCQFVVQELKSLLSDASFQTMIENFIKNEICSHFGLNKESCENDITEYYSAVINLILQYLTPNICSDIRLCTKQSLLHMAKKPFVLGDKRCMWGPGFWCASRAYAQMCGVGAVRHCELNVWK